jgi:UDP-glucose 4-epimerase
MYGSVILTGYNGFVGSHTLEALEAAGLEIILAGHRPVDKKRHEFVPVDLEDPYSIKQLFSIRDVSAVVHLAANISLSDQIDHKIFSVNTLSTGLISEYCAKRGAKMIYSSTAIVHGMRTIAITRDSPIMLDTPYGSSKYNGEILIANSGCKYAILRFGGIFGLRGPSHLGLNRAIDGALEGKVPVLIGAGSARRNYLYVKDAAQMIVSATTSADISGVHLAAGSEELSLEYMLETLSQKFLSVNCVHEEGPDASDQLIEVSEKLPPGRSFESALIDLWQDAGR